MHLKWYKYQILIYISIKAYGAVVSGVAPNVKLLHANFLIGSAVRGTARLSIWLELSCFANQIGADTLRPGFGLTGMGT